MLNIKLLVQSEKIESDVSKHWCFWTLSPVIWIWTSSCRYYLKFFEIQPIYRMSIHFVSGMPHITNHAMYSKYKKHETYMMLDGVRSNRVMYMNINLKENLYCWKNLDFLASIKLYLLVLVYMHFQLYTIELGSLNL